MAQSVSSINLQAWDSELAANDADFSKLYQEMLQASKDTSMENVEILWRLAKVTYLVSLNALEPKEIKEKTQEVMLYAEKALTLDANHFEANLWQASATCKFLYDFVENDLQQELKSFAIFLKHLNVCIKLKPQDAMVLCMEGRMQILLSLFSPEEKVAMEQHMNAHNLPVPVLDLASAETKLRKSIELNPSSIDSYVTLAHILVSSICKKFSETRELIDKGLALRRVTKSDETLARTLQQLELSLPPY